MLDLDDGSEVTSFTPWNGTVLEPTRLGVYNRYLIGRGANHCDITKYVHAFLKEPIQASFCLFCLFYMSQFKYNLRKA